MAALDINALDWVDRARFWSKVKAASLAHCWPWRGSKRAPGYGCIKLLGKTRQAHRIAYGLATGEMPDEGQIVRHKCDNPSCCNPSHLVLGTHADNVADRVRRQRSAYGEKSGRAKLTEEEVLHIAESEMDSKVLARMYGVTRHTIYSIRQKRIWKHLWEESDEKRVAIDGVSNNGS